MIYNPIFVNINNVVIKTLLPLFTAVIISAIVNLNFHDLKLQIFKMFEIAQFLAILLAIPLLLLPHI